MARTVAEVMVDQLVTWKVKYVFGVVGDGIFYLLDALAKRPEIKFIAARHEETAALMASAYAKYTGQIAVCIATTGPGFIHLLNGLADASKDRVPLVAITGQVARKDIGTNKKQYIDQQPIVQALVSYSSLLVDPAATEKVLTKAFKTAIAQKTVAHLTVPKDVFELPCETAIRTSEPYLFTVAESSDQVIRSSLEFFNRAKRPVILAGVGARKAAKQVQELAEKWGAGVIHTLGGIGVITGDHPLALGGLGHAGSPLAEEIIKRADVCFRIGVNWWPTKYTPKDITIIELDADPANIGESSPANYGLVGDVSKILPRITELLEPKERTDWRGTLQKGNKDWHEQIKKEVTAPGEPIPPAVIVDSISRMVHYEAVICLDTGEHTIWFGRNFRPKQQQILLSGKWRTMGFGLPAAMAAKIADQHRQVLALVGDGGFGMLLADFTTAVKYNLPIVVMVVNNGGLILEKNRMQVGDLIPLGVHLTNPDFALFAKACGGEGFTVKNSAELDSKISAALNCGKPAIINIVADQTMVPGTKMGS